MSQTDELFANNRAYAENFTGGNLPTSPSRKLAVLACMDSRLDLFGALGLGEGQVHMVRNAGGLVTEDAIRSLMISQNLLGTQEILVIHHTRCGMDGMDEEATKDRIEAATGARPRYKLGSFADLDTSVRSAVEELRSSPFISNPELVRGCIYDVDTGRLREVT